jgi:hypothetical protein
MTPHALIRAQRIRKLALTVGVLAGMLAGSLFSPMAHAAVKKKAAKPATKAAVQLPEASDEQLQAAERVLIGRYDCEFGKRVLVDRNDKNPGYINLLLDKQSWVMKPVLSSTGAIRLEDVSGRTLLLQILTKSMLMDVKAGRRLVDGCVHEVQRAAEEELRRHPPAPSNLQ